MTRKSWTQIAGLACGLGLLSVPSRAEDVAALKQLKDLAGADASLPTVAQPAAQPVSTKDAQLDPESQLELNARLIEAADYNNLGEVKTMLAQGAQIDARRPSDGSTALNLAARRGYGEIVRFLLASGADADAQDNSGNASLMLAARRGDAQTMALLLDFKADVNAKDRDGGSALYYAACGHPAGVKLLLDRNPAINVDARTDVGSTALMCAAVNGDMDSAAMLLDRGAKTDLREDFRYGRVDGYTALMKAVTQGKSDMVRFLLSRGADVNARSATGATALIVAAYAGKVDSAVLLLDRGAQVDAQETHGYTALIMAVREEKTDMVRLLLARGANAFIKDQDGHDAYYHSSGAVKSVLEDHMRRLPNSVRTTVICASENFQYRTCDSGVAVILSVGVQQLSKAPCVAGQTWGRDGSNIWVNGGCRASFEIIGARP